MSNLVVLCNVVTEKAHKMNENSVYSFIVVKDATKEKIKKEIELFFGVKVSAIKTVTVAGRSKAFKGKKGHTAGYKKAYVHLVPGMKIDIQNLNLSNNV